MKKILMLAALTAAFSAFAQTATPAAAAKPATVTAVCKDGTPYSGETLKGACRGHGGVNKKAGAAATAPAPAVAPATATANAAPTKSAAPAAATAQAPGAGAGQVWANSATKVYHCPGDRYYGKTKQGEYMTEAAAKAAGMRASHGKACPAK